MESNDPDGVVIILWLKILRALWPHVFWKYQPIALVFAKKLQSYQAYLYSNQMNEKYFLIHNVFKMFCHVTYFMHTFITVCYIATLDANLNCLFQLLWRYTLHIKFPLVPRCHVVINLPILMSARQKQHLLGEWWCAVRSLKWLWSMSQNNFFRSALNDVIYCQVL